MTARAEDPQPEPTVDLRLLLPALVAWCVSVALLPWGALACGVTACVTALGAGLVVRMLRHGPRRRTSQPLGITVLLALSLAATTLVTGAAALHLAHDTAGPVPAWARERAVMLGEGTVLSEPHVVDHGDEQEAVIVLRLRLSEVVARGQRARPATPVLVVAPTGQGWEELAWRSRVRVAGRLGEPDPGQDVVAVLRARGRPATVSGPGPLLTGLDVVRARFRQAVDPLPTDARGLIPGLVVGDTSLTPADLSDAMRETGMTHLSAVSGSNVAIVLAAVALILARTGVRRSWRTPLTLLALVGFVLLCRPEPSVLRAAVMGGVGVMALSRSRRRVSLPALAASILVLLCWDPWLARSFGFALSTLATLGLVLLARPWGLFLAGRLPSRLALLGQATAVPLAAQAVCAPVIVLLQGTISTVSVVANLVAAPLVAPTTILGVVAALVAPLSVAAARCVAWVAAIPAWLLGRVARTGAVAPLRTVEWVDGPTGALLLAVLTIAVITLGPRVGYEVLRRTWLASGIVVLLAALLAPVPGAGGGWPPRGWAMAGCDVGQGDAFVLPSGPGAAVVVDVGPEPEAVRRCLADLGIRRVDLLVLTHFHADHVGGLEGVLAGTTVARTLVTSVRDPPEQAEVTLGRLAERSIPVEVGATGQVLDVGTVHLEVLSPGPRPIAGESAANNASLVLLAEVGGTTALLTGDIEPEALGPVRTLAEQQGLDVDVLKVAHHGSARQDPELVRDLRPEVAMIGVGVDNDFGHPAPRTLDLLAQVGAVVLRTDTEGDLAVLRDREGRLATLTRTGP